MSKAATLQQFSDKTALLPWLVADTVLRKRQMDYEPWVGEFTNYVEARTVKCFNNNEQFRKQMLSSKRREWLYAFVEHWLDGWLTPQGRERAREWIQ